MNSILYISNTESFKVSFEMGHLTLDAKDGTEWRSSCFPLCGLNNDPKAAHVLITRIYGYAALCGR